jgi:hypothetical protein
MRFEAVGALAWGKIYHALVVSFEMGGIKAHGSGNYNATPESG